MKDGFYLDFDGEIAIKLDGEWYWSYRYGQRLGTYTKSNWQEDWEESMKKLGFLIVEV